MTKSETTKLVMSALAAYPNTNISESKILQVCSVWHKAFGKDNSYQDCDTALINVLCTSRFFPTIMDMKEAITELQNPDIKLDAHTALGLVNDAVSKFGWPREVEALESLPSEVAELVRSFGWVNICESVPAHFVAKWNNAWNNRVKSIKHNVATGNITGLQLENVNRLKAMIGGE